MGNKSSSGFVIARQSLAIEKELCCVITGICDIISDLEKSIKEEIQENPALEEGRDKEPEEEYNTDDEEYSLHISYSWVRIRKIRDSLCADSETS